MASKPFKSLFRGTGRNALDLPVAGLAALAAAFAAFAVPQELLSRAVIATGLPSILSAAQPPLGLTARVAIAVGAAAITFGLVFLLLRLLDRSGMGGSVRAQEEADALAPRVRRRDVHPDAPSRRPISAARDFGEPAPPEMFRPVPIWLDEAEPVAAPAFEPEPEPVHEPEPVADLLPEPEPVFAPEPEPVAVTPEPEPEPEVVAEPEPEPVALVEPEPTPEPAPDTQAEMPTSIAALMERLEQGLVRRRMPASAPTIPATPPQVFPEAAEEPDDRLQSAIASLQRLAARSS